MIEPLRILIVDDSAEDRAVYKRLLIQKGDSDYLFSEAETVDDALICIHQDPPDCILLDYHLPDRDGLELLTELYAEYLDKTPAIVMLTGEGNEQIAVQAMKDGAQDYLVKSHIDAQNLAESIGDAIEKAGFRYLSKLRESELKRLAVTDALTGLYSSDYAIHRLQEETYRALRYGTPFSIALIELDRFNQIVERFGQLPGEKALKDIATRIKMRTRVLDVVSHYEYGKFLVILPNITIAQASIVLSRIHSMIRSLRFGRDEESHFQLTCSIGMSEFDIGVKDKEMMMNRTNIALLEAKNRGCDQLFTWSEFQVDSLPQAIGIYG